MLPEDLFPVQHHRVAMDMSTFATVIVWTFGLVDKEV